MVGHRSAHKAKQCITDAMAPHHVVARARFLFPRRLARVLSIIKPLSAEEIAQVLERIPSNRADAKESISDHRGAKVSGRRELPYPIPHLWEERLRCHP